MMLVASNDNASNLPSPAEVDAIVLGFQRNVVVAASAGTGKTHRLTALYVLLSLGLTSMGKRSASEAAAPVPPDRIWATTFTRAAAREIAERVERALARLAKDPEAPDAPFAAEIAARRALLDDPPSPAVLRRRAAEALARWPAARIDTLHGLAGRLVDRHGLTLGLPPGMRVLDEDEASYLGALAVDEVLSRSLGGGGEAATAARALLTAVGGISPLRAQLLRLFDRLDEEGVEPSALVLADHAAAAREALSEVTAVAERVAADAGILALRAAASRFGAALKSAPSSGEVLPEAAVEPLLELLTIPMRGKKRGPDEELDAFRKSIGRDALRLNAERFAAFLRRADDLGERERGMIRLLDEARAAARTRRRRAGALGFGDLLRAARDGLRDRPDLAETVRADVDVLLVDEFQDTSTVQRDLVYLLRERESSRRERQPGTVPEAAALERHGLFLVGDRKQSIYGFRGADVAVFSRICAELGGDDAAFALRLPKSRAPRPAHADFVALAESRRSGASILSFVNAFAACDFSEGRSSEAEARDFEIEYSPAEHLAPVRPPEERGEVVHIEDDGAVPEGADALAREAEGPLREALVAAAWLASDLRRTGRPPRDYAVLARRRNTLPLVSVALDRLGVPYVVAGRALYDAPEVRDVAALVRLTVEPRDRLALATVLRGPVVALSDTALAALSEPGRGLAPVATAPLPERAALLTASEARRLDGFRTMFGALRRAALRAPPAEALRALVTGFDLDRVLAALPRAEARLANVDRLIAIAGERGGSLAAFARWLDRRIADESDEPEGVVFAEEDDAVRLLTIHGSKGLDFKVVVLVDLAAEPRPAYPGVDLVPPQGERGASLLIRHFSPLRREAEGEYAPLLLLPTPALRAAQAESRAREQAERRRLTYVALTRARDTLVLVSPSQPARGSSAWRTLSVALPPEARATITRTERAVDLLSAAHAMMEAPAAPAAAREEPRRRLELAEAPRAAAKAIALPTTALSLFSGCARRYRLRYLLGYDEPLASTQLELFALSGDDGGAADLAPPIEEDARDVGRAAHRVLERVPLARWGTLVPPQELADRLVIEGVERSSPDVARLAEGISRWLDGPYVRAVLASQALALREEPFLLEVEPGPQKAKGAVALALRGTMDLVVRGPENRIDVIDYKRSRPRADLAPYIFQLRAYALALARRFPGHRIRAGVVFLGADEVPRWLPGREGTTQISELEHASFAASLGALAARYAEARASDVWDGEPIDACRALGCGFITACHRNKPKGR